jgi:hypothetical protein
MSLEIDIGCFQSIQSIEQLQSRFPKAFMAAAHPLYLGDREPDTIDRDPDLVSHFVLDRRWPRRDLRFN